MRERGYSFWVIVAALVGAPLSGCYSSHVSSTVQDRDGDGYTSDVDCDDDDETVHPGASESCAFSCTPPYGDGRDNDCDGVIDEECGPVTNCFWDAGPLPVDADGDGYPVESDCDDSNAAIHPGAAESCCDGVDSDCDGDDDPLGWECNCFPDAGPPDPDLDLDGYAQSLDCNDGDASVHPGAVEWCGDGIDQDCDGLVDESDCVFVGNGMLDAPPALESTRTETDAPA